MIPGIQTAVHTRMSAKLNELKQCCREEWTTFLHSHDFCHTEKCASSYCCFYKPLNYGAYLVFTGLDDNGFYLDNASLIVALNQKNSVNYVNLFTFLTNMQIITNSNSI